MTDFTYKGEAMLLSWSDSSAGRKVTFLLPDEGEEHPFKGHKCGPAHGQTFALGCKAVVVGESEPDPEKPKRDRKESEICAMLCGDERFQEWLKKRHVWASFEVTHPSYDDESEEAASFIRWYCYMESRRALDSDPEGEPLKRWLSLKAQYQSETGLTTEQTR